MTEIIFVRHGTSVNNEEDRWNSSRENDKGLTEAGLEEARLLAQRLKQEKLEAIYCSPFPRALQTAQEINAFHGLEIIVDERLRERNGGVLDGLTKQDGREKYAREHEEYAKNKAYYRFPGAETHCEVRDRAKQFIETAKKHAGTVLAVTHEAVVFGALAAVFDDFSFIYKNAPRASLTRVKLGSKPVLESFADDSHLRMK
ncbi:MAG: histidine phosphatase family protein [Candidatus Micrarchaeota archaeon]